VVACYVIKQPQPTQSNNLVVGHTGEVAMPQELGQAWCGEAGRDSR
jgi:hypothetical protein